MAICNGDSLVEVIEPTECIGNSLRKINGNFKALDISTCTASSVTDAIVNVDGILKGDGLGVIGAAVPGADYYRPGDALNYDLFIYGKLQTSGNIRLLPGAHLTLDSGDVTCDRLNANEVTVSQFTVTGNTKLQGEVTVGSKATFQTDAVVTGNLTIGGSTIAQSIKATKIEATGTIYAEGLINSKGDIVAFQSQTSDKRFKKNITVIPNSLEKIKLIRGVEFEWDESIQTEYKGQDVGVIAQEIEQVLPTAVTTRNDGSKAVNYVKIIPLLIEAIKELKEQNIILQTEIELLKSR